MPVYSRVEEGEYFGNILSIADTSGGWIVDIDVHTYDLYANSFIQGLKVGDYLEVAGYSYQVMSKGEEYIEMDGFFLARRQDGYWVACSPGGSAIMYSIGTESFFVPATAKFLNNSMLDNTEGTSPWDILNDIVDDSVPGVEPEPWRSIIGWVVRFIVSDHQITYMESIYYP